MLTLAVIDRRIKIYNAQINNIENMADKIIFVARLIFDCTNKIEAKRAPMICINKINKNHPLFSIAKMFFTKEI